MTVREMNADERERLKALHAWLYREERDEHEAEDLDTRLEQRLQTARTMPEHQAALEMIGDMVRSAHEAQGIIRP